LFIARPAPCPAHDTSSEEVASRATDAVSPAAGSIPALSTTRTRPLEIDIRIRSDGFEGSPDQQSVPLTERNANWSLPRIGSSQLLLLAHVPPLCATRTPPLEASCPEPRSPPCSADRHEVAEIVAGAPSERSTPAAASHSPCAKHIHGAWPPFLPIAAIRAGPAHGRMRELVLGAIGTVNSAVAHTPRSDNTYAAPWNHLRSPITAYRRSPICSRRNSPRRHRKRSTPAAGQIGLAQPRARRRDREPRLGQVSERRGNEGRVQRHG